VISTTMPQLVSQKFYTDTSVLKSHVQMLRDNASKTATIKSKCFKRNCQGKKSFSRKLQNVYLRGSFQDLESLSAPLGHELFLMKTIVERIDDNLIDHLVAHRGFHCTKDCPTTRPLENTLAAYEQAWTLGMKHAECDVVLTKDDRLMLCHDNTFERLAMFPSRKSFVDKHPNKLEAKEVLTKCVTKSGACVPFLTHVLDIAAAIGVNKKLIIELKPGLDRTYIRLIEVLKSNPEYLNNISVIMSFQLSLIQNFAGLFRKEFPVVTELKLLYLMTKPEDCGRYPQPYNHFPIERPDELDEIKGELDGFYVGHSRTFTTSNRNTFQNVCRKYVIGVYNMEPDCVSRAQELCAIGVAYVNTDMPRDLKKIIT